MSQYHVTNIKKYKKEKTKIIDYLLFINS